MIVLISITFHLLEFLFGIHRGTSFLLHVRFDFVNVSVCNQRKEIIVD